MRELNHCVRWVAVAALVACNSLTGADGVEFVEGTGGKDGAVGPTSSATTGSAAVGSTSSATTGSAGATTTAASTGGSSNSTASASSSTGAACVYPAGPYGVAQGKILPSNLKWEGYPAGGTVQGSLSIEVVLDCDGSKGITAILFDSSQFG